MSTRAPDPARDEQRLGQLAMGFRGARDEATRAGIAAEYALTVERLVRSGQWVEMPPPEDQLPDAHMPRQFFAYWSSPD